MLQLLSLIIVGQAPGAFDLAVTVDDLPYVGPVAHGETAQAAELRIVEALKKHHVPVTGFVVCSRITTEATLDPWLRAQVPLSNHSTQHKSIDALPARDWDSDVRGCAEKLKTLAHAPPEYFRFPFLMTGATQERRDEALRKLHEWSMKPAPVSIDTSEWALAAPYVKAKDSGDAATVKAIQQAYVEHVLRATRHYRAVSREVAGREVKQVLLLHANALAADTLDALLVKLQTEHARFVALPDALNDPVYSQADQWAGKVGLSWLYRLGPQTRERWSWDDAEATALQLRFDGATFPAGGLQLDRDQTLFQLEPGLYVLRTGQPLAHNALVAEMEDGSILIAGSTFTPPPMARLIDWLHARYGEVKLIAIDTHHHWDASAGNEAITQAGGETWAPDLTAQLLKSEEEPMRKGVLEMLKDRTDAQKPFESLHVQAPQHTFPIGAGKTFKFGHEEAKVIFPGEAHARDTVAVWLPKRRALFGGCMVVSTERPGNISDANLAEWPKSIAKLKKLDPKWVVPGHGDRYDAALLDDTVEAVKRVQADAGR
jgi:glyoxylase-like metal-dependent hydrolase (beta-lactamase superfamily II)/peptidoglycan/xylan/chitin deacetylase (PgdA/CDA1 family)